MQFFVLCGFILFGSLAICEVVPAIIGVYPVPVSETEEFVVSWLQESGFTVSKELPEAGKTRFKANKAGEVALIEIRPQSPLGSLVEVCNTTNVQGFKPSTIGDLKAALERYILSIYEKNSHKVDTLPDKVKAMVKAIVCLRTSTDGEPVQFSGFAIDRRGVIVATAHDLDAEHNIITDEDGGVGLKGEVIKWDPLRDLSLIKVKNIFETAVSVKNIKRQLKSGDRVYSIGCPQNFLRKVQIGIVEGPPAMVNGQPLWQVNMEVLPGSSGSPVFDSDGKLVGVVKGRYRGTLSRGFLIPIDTIQDFLGRGTR